MKKTKTWKLIGSGGTSDKGVGRVLKRLAVALGGVSSTDRLVVLIATVTLVAIEERMSVRKLSSLIVQTYREHARKYEAAYGETLPPEATEF